MKSTNKVSSGIPNLKKQDGSLTTTDQEASEVLNEQYYKQFTKEAGLIRSQIHFKNQKTHRYMGREAGSS